MKKKESHSEKRTDRNRESGYHADKERTHVPGQHAPDAEPKHDPPARQKKDLDRDPEENGPREENGHKGRKRP